jgi:hypothetical protein
VCHPLQQADPDALNPGIDALLTTLEWLVAEHHEPGDEQTTGRRSAPRHGTGVFGTRR